MVLGIYGLFIIFFMVGTSIAICKVKNKHFDNGSKLQVQPTRKRTGTMSRQVTLWIKRLTGFEMLPF
jgi:hypothetical protein